MTIKLRQHQSQLNQVIDGIIQGSQKYKNIRKIILSVVAGGGKGSVPVNVGKLYNAGLIDSICCIVPRTSLQTQCEEVCMNDFFKKLFEVNISIRASTNERSPCRGQHGFVTTYQAIGVDKNKYVLSEIKKKRYCVILDEPHHCAVDSPWHLALEKIIKNAEFVIMMSGTLSRADKQKISFLKYKNGLVDLSGDEETHVIIYSRADALREKAILPIEFHTRDASVEFETHDGKFREYSNFRSVKKDDQSSALFTALETEFADKLTDEALSHWLTYRKDHPESKIIFVCARRTDAIRRTEYLRKLGVPALLATSHETKECIENLDAFKKNAPALVAIAIPYEGLDVPPASHGCVLTRYRSNEWLEQFVSRFVRVHEGPYRIQRAHIFAPKDPKFLRFIEAINLEQKTRANNNTKEEQLPLFELFETPQGGSEQGPCIPLKSQIIELSKQLNGNRVVFEREVLTPKQEEMHLRRDIDRYLKRYAYDQGYEFIEVNKTAKQINAKARAEMTLAELKYFFNRIQTLFPLIDKGAFIPISNCAPIFDDHQVKEFNLKEERFF